MDLQGYTFSVQHRSGKKNLLPDAVSRLLRNDDIAYVNTADDLRDDYGPLTEQEAAELHLKFKGDSDYIIETINEFRLTRGVENKIKEKKVHQKLRDKPVVKVKPIVVDESEKASNLDQPIKSGDVMGRMLDSIPTDSVDIKWSEFMKEEPTDVDIQLCMATVQTRKRDHMNRFQKLSELGNIRNEKCPITTINSIRHGRKGGSMAHHHKDVIVIPNCFHCECSAVAVSTKLRR